MPAGQGFLVDLDGTLVDSVYQHVLAWQEALDQLGIAISVWRIHRKIGMSGGLFANALLRETGRAVGGEEAARLRALHAEAYGRRVDQVRPLPGSRELLSFLQSADEPWAIATSGYLESRDRSSSVTACGTCWRHDGRARSEWGCSRAATARTSWSAPAPTACTRTPPISCGTSTRSA